MRMCDEGKSAGTTANRDDAERRRQTWLVSTSLKSRNPMKYNS